MDENSRGVLNWDSLNRAIPVYVGYKRRAFPSVDWQGVVDQLGFEEAHSVELALLGVLADLRAQKPDWRTHDLYQGSEWAVRQLDTKYRLDDRSKKALVWLFSYENK